MSEIKLITNDTEFIKFVSMRMMHAWKANTRPDLVFQISQISKVTCTMYKQDVSKNYERLKNAIKYAYSKKSSMRILKFDYKSLRIIAYSDTAFAKNAGLS